MAVSGVWLAAFVLYALFLAWHQNLRGPLSQAEISKFVDFMNASPTVADGRNSADTLREFLEKDDGKEFFMLNLVKFHDGQVADPKTAQMRSARDIMEGYTKMFMPALFAKGGYPALAARKVGGYVDAWGVEADPNWSIVGYMRYRSRRDMIELVMDPRFSDSHPFKLAAMPVTFSFPTQPMIMTFSSPRLWVGLGVCLGASLVHIALLSAQISAG